MDQLVSIARYHILAITKALVAKPMAQQPSQHTVMFPILLGDDIRYSGKQVVGVCSSVEASGFWQLVRGAVYTDAVAIDIPPRVRMDKSELVRGDAYYRAVLLVHWENKKGQIAFGHVIGVWQARSPIVNWAGELGEGVEINIIHQSVHPKQQSLFWRAVVLSVRSIS